MFGHKLLLKIWFPETFPLPLGSGQAFVWSCKRFLEMNPIFPCSDEQIWWSKPLSPIMLNVILNISLIIVWNLPRLYILAALGDSNCLYSLLSNSNLSSNLGPNFIALLSGRFFCLLCDFYFIALLTVSTRKGMLTVRCLPHENKWRHNANPR